MKKFIIVLLIGLSLVLAPISIKAETTTAQILNEQYKAILLQLIDLLQQEIKILQEKLNILLATQQNLGQASTTQELTRPVQEAASNTQTFVENTPTIPLVEIPQPIKLNLINIAPSNYYSSHIIMFVNPTSHNLKINFLNITTNYSTGTFQVSIRFPNSPDENSTYPFGSIKIYNYSETVYYSCVPSKPDRIYCDRNLLPYPQKSGVFLNIVKPGETVMIIAGLAKGGGEYIPKLSLNYTEGSITDTITGENILFNTSTEFSN